MKKLPIGALVCAVLTGLCALSAHGQEGNSSGEMGTQGEGLALEVVVVTARKRQENLLDVPASVAAISADAIEKARITRLEDIGHAVPGLNINTRSDSEPNVVIRGVGAFGNTQGVGFYIDEVQNFTDQSASTSEVAQIEVLKGPQGTLYGGNNIGGAVKVTLHAPGEEFGGNLFVERGSRNTASYAGAVDVPLLDGRLLTRFAASYRSEDGYIDNRFLGEEIDHSEERSARFALQADLTENLVVDFSTRYSSLDSGAFLPLVLTDSFDEITFEADLSEDTFIDRTVWGNILKLSYDTDIGSFKSISSFTEREVDWNGDLDYSPLNILNFFSNENNEASVLTQEFRYATPEDSAVDVVAGLYYSRVEDALIIFNGDGIINGDGLPIPGLPPVPVFVEDSQRNSLVEEQAAVFISAIYETGSWAYSLGGRYNRVDIRGENFGAPLFDVDPFVENIEDDEFLPKASISYHLDDNKMLYATYARGYEPGGINFTAPELPVYAPETAESLEAGVKGSALDERMNFTFAVYSIRYKDRQFEDRVFEGATVVEAVRNIGDSDNVGIELSVDFAATDNLKIGGGVNWIDSEWDSAFFEGQSFDGNTPPDTPDLQLSAYADYYRPVFDGYHLISRLDVSYRSSSYWDIANLAEQDSYQLVNLGIGLESPSADWTVMVQASNLFDEEYYTEGFYDFQDSGMVGADGSCDACHGALPARPRTVTASIRYRF